jgi:hypothetical protein
MIGDKNVKCLICNSNSSYYFSKTYHEPLIECFMRKIGEIGYYKCDHCGFVLSKTHRDLDESVWNHLNSEFHHYLENPENERKINQPPYAEQAMMICILGRNGIINTNQMIDFAAGYGTLSQILKKYFELDLPLFDPYVRGKGSKKYVEKADFKIYKTVINSAMFEHILKREDLDQVNRLVDSDGCLIVHTHINEEVPKDPDWFYLNPPVHTAFHTNKSMGILMEQWGYQSSIYCLPSKCWVLLKCSLGNIDKRVEKLNQELQNNWFFCKRGFVDYWKSS